MRNRKPKCFGGDCAGGVKAHVRAFRPSSQECDGIPCFAQGETFHDQKQAKHFGWKTCMFNKLQLDEMFLKT